MHFCSQGILGASIAVFLLCMPDSRCCPKHWCMHKHSKCTALLIHSCIFATLVDESPCSIVHLFVHDTLQLTISHHISKAASKPIQMQEWTFCPYLACGSRWFVHDGDDVPAAKKYCATLPHCFVEGFAEGFARVWQGQAKGSIVP